MDILAEVPDPRKQKGKRHSLRAILALGIVATLSGAKSYAAIAEYGRSHDNSAHTRKRLVLQRSIMCLRIRCRGFDGKTETHGRPWLSSVFAHLKAV